MKTWLLLAFVCTAAFTALGVEPQSRVKGDAIYLYCSASTQDTREGIERFEDAENDNDPLFAHRPISFEMKSKQKNNTFNPITLENKLASFKTKEESWAWVDSLKATGKQIYLIDWSDPVNGSGGTELRLIQVAPTTINRPLF